MTSSDSKQAVWFTCTPMRFQGGEPFFARDSGLVCRTFQSLGIPSKAISLGPPMEGDCPDLIRASKEQLESPAWWKSLHIDGLLFYSWADARYNSIAKAIKEAGIFLVVNIDSKGLISPVVSPFRFFPYVYSCSPYRGLRRWLQMLRYCGQPLYDVFRLRHFKYADVVTGITPQAVANLKAFVRHYGCFSLSKKILGVSHPIAPQTLYAHEEKKKHILAVGRWETTDDRFYKRPEIALPALTHALKARPDYQAFLIGRGATGIAKEMAAIYAPVKDRLHFYDFLPIEELGKHMTQAHISLCTSLSEGFHTVSAEALCAGCSLASYDAEALAPLRYFVQGGKFGSLAPNQTPEAIAQAIIDECDAWDQGKHNPSDISSFWQNKILAPQVAKKILSLLP